MNSILRKIGGSDAFVIKYGFQFIDKDGDGDMPPEKRIAERKAISGTVSRALSK